MRGPHAHARGPTDLRGIPVVATGQRDQSGGLPLDPTLECDLGLGWISLTTDRGGPRGQPRPLRSGLARQLPRGRDPWLISSDVEDDGRRPVPVLWGRGAVQQGLPGAPRLGLGEPVADDDPVRAVPSLFNRLPMPSRAGPDHDEAAHRREPVIKSRDSRRPSENRAGVRRRRGADHHRRRRDSPRAAGPADTLGGDPVAKGEIRVAILGSGGPGANRSQGSASVLIEVGNEQGDFFFFFRPGVGGAGQLQRASPTRHRHHESASEPRTPTTSVTCPSWCGALPRGAP